MDSQQVKFEIRKGGRFTSLDFKDVMCEEFSDREIRILFSLVMRVWKANGLVVEVGKKSNPTKDGRGRKVNEYEAVANLTFVVGEDMKVDKQNQKRMEMNKLQSSDGVRPVEKIINSKKVLE